MDGERRDGMGNVLRILGEIQVVQTGILKEQAVMSVQLTSNNEMTKQMHTVIYENGLVSSIEVLKTESETYKGEIKELQRYKRQDRAVSAGSGLFGGFMAVLVTKVPFISKFFGGP